MKVSCSIAVNPPSQAADEPVPVAVLANVVFPRCSKLPVLVMVAVVADVKVKLPEKLPPKGVEWEAKTTGNAPTSRTAIIAGVRTSIFILITDHLHLIPSSTQDPAVSGQARDCITSYERSGERRCRPRVAASNTIGSWPNAKSAFAGSMTISELCYLRDEKDVRSDQKAFFSLARHHSHYLCV